jgi:hypothetical protein
MKTLKCPVCQKPLTQAEYDKALGLWDEKQEHIKHLEAERQELRAKEKQYKEQVRLAKITSKKERQQLLRQFKQQTARQARQAADKLKEQRLSFERVMESRLRAAVAKSTAQQKREMQRQAKDLQRSQSKLSQLEKTLTARIEAGVTKGVAEQKRAMRKQEVELRRTKNKMNQLQNSLRVSADKYRQASEEIKRLKQQIEQGVTPQIEGLLEEKTLLAKLKELYPQDQFEHTGKGGDILQIVMDHGKKAGLIVYECKKVKNFDKNHVEQAKRARIQRGADFAVLVTNAFPKKRQFYFVEKDVFVISPVSLEPITYSLRESLVRMAILKITNQAKAQAVQRVCEYLSSSEYNMKINEIASQLIGLGDELKTEITVHKRSWTKRYEAYRALYQDIGGIDHCLRQLVHGLQERKPVQALPEARREYVQIPDLEGKV